MLLKSTGHKRGHYRIIVLITIWALYIINNLDKTAVLTLLPYIRKELGLSPATVGFAASLFFLAYALVQLPAGMLADKYGQKKVMTFAITVFTFFTFLTGRVTSLATFIAVRVGLGFGEGFHFVPSIRTISEWFPKKEKGRATAFFMTTITIGPAIGAVIITGIAASWGWRSVFYTLSVPGVLGILLLWYFMKDSPEKAHKEGKISKEELDYIREDSAATNVINKANLGIIAKDPQLWIITAIVFVKTSVHWGTATWISSWLVEQHGFNIKTMGLLASLPWVIGFLSQMVSGWMLDKVTKSKSKPLLIFAFTGLSVILFFVTIIPKGSIPLLILGLVILGFFDAFYDPPIYTYVQMRYPQELIGTATGFTQAIGQFGSFITPTVAGFLIVTGGASGIANYSKVFYLFMTIAIIGAILSILIKESPLKITNSNQNNSLNM